MHDIYGLPINARLVVLSACQTGVGSGLRSDVPAGDEWVGLSRAFLLAGAQRVVATLWPVADGASAELMVWFHTGLAIGAGGRRGAGRCPAAGDRGSTAGRSVLLVGIHALGGTMTGVVQRLRRPAALTTVYLLASCGSDASGPGTDTTGTNAAPRGLAVSAPVPAPGGGEPDGTVAFVSAFPGTVVRAATAQVVLGGTAVHPVPALDGGFDPVAVPARAGDQVRVVLTDSAGSTTSVTATVRSATHPRVVRTSPAPRRTDVPLNAIIRVVFSTPMTLESVREGVRLTQAGARVAAEVEAGDASGVAYDLVPVEELVPATEYAIEIGAVVEDVNGVPLGEAVTAPFTTTSSSTPAAAAYVTLVTTLAGSTRSGKCLLAARSPFTLVHWTPTTRRSIRRSPSVPSSRAWLSSPYRGKQGGGPRRMFEASARVGPRLWPGLAMPWGAQASWSTSKSIGLPRWLRRGWSG